MTKILFINPSVKEDEFGNLKSVCNIIPPLGLGCLASVLEKEGFLVKIIDCSVHPIYFSKLTSIIKENKPDIIGYSATTLSINNAILSATALKEVCPQSLFVIG